MGEDLVSEWHSSVSSASDSRCGEQVLNIKATQQRNLGKWPLLIWDIQGWDTLMHICTHANTETPQKGSIPLQWYSKAERTYMFNSQPSISACSCSMHCDPQPPPSIPDTPRSRKSKEEMNKVGREWVSTYGGWGKANNISYFPERSLCNGSTTFQTNPVTLLGIDMSFLLISSMFPKRVFLLTAHHPTSCRLCLTVPRWLSDWTCSDSDPFVFI